MSEVIVGIDLGTTNSLVAVCDSRGPRVLIDPRHGSAGRALLPSVVRFREHDGSVESIGDEALQGVVEHSSRTVSGAKRAMGRGCAEVEGQLRGAGRVEADTRGRPVYAIGAQRIAPERVSAEILRELRERANAALAPEYGPGACRRAVITVPAYFDDAQRQATRDAARLAGVDAVRIINEPTAAALAYGIGRAGSASETIAVFDLGGGTFDISILEVTPPPRQGTESVEQDAGLFRVLSTAGDTALGGDDLDAAIAESLFPEQWARGPAQERLALVEACRQAKCELSVRGVERACVRVAGVERTMDRAALREIARPWTARALRACERAWNDAGRVPIDRLLMVGGSTRSPFVRDAAGEFFGVEPSTALDPDEVVALGASVQATVLAGSRSDLLLLDVVPLSLGIETVGGAVAKLIMRNATIPTHATEMFSTSVDGQRRVAIHILQGERELVADCRSLARCELVIPPMPAGIPQVEVMFTIDASGLLRVTARERRTGASVQVQVIPTYGLSAEEVEAMEREAWANARVDMHRHRVIDLVAHASLDLAWVDGAIRRAGDSLAAEARVPLTDAAASLRTLVDMAQRNPDGVDADEFQRAKEALDRASVPVHEASITQTLRQMEGVDEGRTP